MAGPIRNLISTIQQRQPVRSAIRGLFGIDSFDEMAARDREQGNDVSNPFPDTGMAPGNYPVRQVAQMEPADENQPFKGKGVFQSVFTPAPNLPRKPQQAPMTAPPGLMERLAEIDASKLSAAEKHQMYADAFYRASIAASKEQQKQLAGIGQDYASRAMFESIRSDEQAAAQKVKDDNEAMRTAEERRLKDEYERTSPLGRQKQVQELLNNPAVSPETAAFQLANDADMALQDKGQSMSPEQKLQLQDSLTRQGYAHRAYQSLESYLGGKTPSILEGGHPLFEPMSVYYRKMAKRDGVAAASNALRADLAQAANKAFLEHEHQSPEEAMRDATVWIEHTVSGVLGDLAPKQPAPASPPPTGDTPWYQMLDFTK